MSSGLKLFRFLKPYWRWAVAAPVLMMLEVTMDLMQPRMVQKIIDEGIANLNTNLIIHTCLLMFGLAVVGAVGGGSNGIFTEVAVQGFSADLREFLFRKVQTFSFSNLDRLDTGQLITRLTNDVTQVQEAIMMILRMLVRAPMLFIGSLIMGIITSPQLAFIPFALLPIEIAAVVIIVRKATPMYTVVQKRLDALNEVMQENLAGVRVVKAFVRAAYEIKRFAAANFSLTDQSIRAARTVALMPSFMMLTMNFGVVAVLWFGGVQINQGNMHIGQVVAFINYLGTTLFSLIMVSGMVIQLARAEASAKRIQEVIEMAPGVQNVQEPKRIPLVHGRVVFEDVTFSYDGNCNDPVLKGISFVAEPGETVAILGSTGSGKSSLVHLIPRFYDVCGGRVTIDGEDVRQLDQEDLRRKVGVALQETVLFSGTIRDNICYGRPEASEDDVIEAAKAAQAHEFILSFPDGYDTQLGQRGVNLSGGQKQRLAIARAILIRPAVIILDDSTSAVDVETESKIQDAFEAMMGQCTTFIIAQRISTVLKADRIIVLDDGQVAAQGTHPELLAASPIYKDIYDSQLGNGEPLHSRVENGVAVQ